MPAKFQYIIIVFVLFLGGCVLQITEESTERTSSPAIVVLPTNTVQEFTPTQISNNFESSFDYGVNLEIVGVKSGNISTNIFLEANIDKRWGMSADWQLTPPNGILMKSLDYPRLYTLDEQEILSWGYQGTPLREGPDGGVIDAINLSSREPLPVGESDFVLHTVVEFSEVRSHHPLIIDLSDQSNGSVWELSETIQVGGVTYTFTQAKLAGNVLELYSDGINEEGYETVTFYAMTEYEPPTQIAYANGGAGDFSDPNLPLVTIDLGEAFNEEIELYFRSSVITTEPFLLPFSLDDYK